MKRYISEEVQQQAALQLHIEMENDCKIEFDNLVCRYEKN